MKYIFAVSMSAFTVYVFMSIIRNIHNKYVLGNKQKNSWEYEPRIFVVTIEREKR